MRTERLLRLRRLESETLSGDNVPERAWKIFDTVSAKIDHADAKAGALLGAAGVVGAAILTLIDTRRNWELDAMIVSALSTALVFVTAACACAALWPRRLRRNEPASLLYFDHVVRSQGQTETIYRCSLRNLLDDPEALTAAISDQIWATSLVATRKYYWIDRAMVSFFGALATLGIAAVILVSHLGR